MGAPDLIWTDGRIVPAGSPLVGPEDRAIIHGVGLFETFRTWGGRPRLLDRHIARLSASAKALGLPIHAGSLPGPDAVAGLIAAMGIGGSDVRLRLTLSGGTSDGGLAVAWLGASALPESTPPEGWRIAAAVEGIGGLRFVHSDDILARHKSLNYWDKDLAIRAARRVGLDESLAVTSDGLVWEGSMTNLFLARRGTLITPGPEGPFLPGVFRGLILERAQALGIRVEVRPVRLAELDEADEVFLSNAVRGMIPVGRIGDRSLESTGPIASSLARDLGK